MVTKSKAISQPVVSHANHTEDDENMEVADFDSLTEDLESVLD